MFGLLKKYQLYVAAVIYAVSLTAAVAAPILRHHGYPTSENWVFAGVLAVAVPIAGLLGWFGVSVTRDLERLMPVKELAGFPMLKFFECTPWQLKEFHKFFHGDEYIEYVAIRHPNGTIYLAASPARHHHVIWYMASIGVNGENGDNTLDQGFVTSSGRFVDRSEAWFIAAQIDQFLHEPHNPGTLHTEDLWDIPQEVKKAEISFIHVQPA